MGWPEDAAFLVPDEVADGRYFLNLQVPRLASDAAPSRPSLHPLRPL